MYNARDSIHGVGFTLVKDEGRGKSFIGFATVFNFFFVPSLNVREGKCNLRRVFNEITMMEASREGLREICSSKRAAIDVLLIESHCKSRFN